jgi:hypothetical protein
MMKNVPFFSQQSIIAFYKFRGKVEVSVRLSYNPARMGNQIMIFQGNMVTSLSRSKISIVS